MLLGAEGAENFFDPFAENYLDFGHVARKENRFSYLGPALLPGPAGGAGKFTFPGIFREVKFPGDHFIISITLMIRSFI